MKQSQSLKNHILFEVTSFIGRKFFKSKSIIPLLTEPVLLDIGVGTNFTKNWIHVDFFEFHNPFRKRIKRINKPEVQCDLRYPLYCPDRTIDGVFSSHTIEHLLPLDAINLLNEVYRILKEGSWLRIIVPDIKIAIEQYLNKTKFNKYTFGCEIIMDYTQNSGHLSSWDEEFLSQVLCEIGFINIKKVIYGTEGTDPRLIKDIKERESLSLVIEAQKSKLN